MPITRYVWANGRDIVSSLIVGAKTSGNHTYVQSSLVGNSTDQTNRGPIWDITKSFRGFWYATSDGAVSLAPGAGTGGVFEISEGPSWLNFGGYWGDQRWPTTKPGQFCEYDDCLIDDGPTGKRVTCSAASRE